MGKVHGTDNLYVCDASLIPSIPRANTNTPTIMMAERIADAHKAA
jgi:5-(hydroxymethyl)furfural/furfural oxidase